MSNEMSPKQNLLSISQLYFDICVLILSVLNAMWIHFIMFDGREEY